MYHVMIQKQVSKNGKIGKILRPVIPGEEIVRAETSLGKEFIGKI